MKHPIFAAAAPSDDTPDSPARGGRGAEERTVQLSLRLPARWVGLLRQRALDAATAEQAMVTPQDIVRRMIARALKSDP